MVNKVYGLLQYADEHFLVHSVHVSQSYSYHCTVLSLFLLSLILFNGQEKKVTLILGVFQFTFLYFGALWTAVVV